MADQGSEGLLSPFLRKQRILAARPYLSGRILDFGCGSGSLAVYVKPNQYFGFDIDEESIKIARQKFPKYNFSDNLDDLKGETFDTIVALAVIEHVQDTVGFLKLLNNFLAINSCAQIVCTTPHPSMSKLHTLGAKVGLFSKHASEEHKNLFDYHCLNDAGNQAGLKMVHYQRFLIGANQIAVFQRPK